ncbi:hypothetical protein [Pseudonocardia alaniniphila]|uniref:Uncharacterized protein n=1 Tax=Pseudonocardia alaniniphila TaxID=75291 RepID=A0ABS9TJF2_9PSEU|nr:hypothetical protein [Pseudonocardia alaniniphila]MCH6168676.1 hypothetical protein [Pseudonocardia alaniniphila]
MSNLHVIYRQDEGEGGSEEWSAYSYPHSIYAAGLSVDEARAEFREAAKFALGDLDQITLVEHIERPLVPGAYIRVAVDRRMLDRDETAKVMGTSLKYSHQLKDFEVTMPLAATGDAVVIACVPSDQLGWIFEQMNDYDAVAVCALGPTVGNMQSAWWSYLAGPEAIVPGDRPQQSLAAGGLSSKSTISDFMRANATATGRTLVGAAG